MIAAVLVLFLALASAFERQPVPAELSTQLATGPRLMGPANAQAAAIGDLDGDGRNDPVVAGITAFTAFLASDPDRGVKGESPGLLALDLALGDVNQDGFIDAVLGGEHLADDVPETARFLSGDGTGRLASQFNALGSSGRGVPVNAIAIADVIGADTPEVIVAAANGLDVHPYETGEGAFAAPISVPGVGLVTSVAVGQLTGDHHADIALLANGGALFIVSGGPSLGDLTPVPLPPGPPPKVVRMGDVAGDGRTDLAVLRPGPADDILILPSGSPSLPELSTGFDATFLEVGDIDGDGRDDLVAGSPEPSCNTPARCGSANSIRILFAANKRGEFLQPVAPPFPISPDDGPVELRLGDIALGDLDGVKGLEILAASNFGESTDTIYRGGDLKPTEPETAGTGGGGGTAGSGTGGGGRETNSARPTGDARATCAGRRATIVGTPAPDRLSGTPGPDVIAGLAGADSLVGRGGDDLVCGGPGHDRIAGGPGRDQLFGERGDDRLDGGKGRDIALGGPGRDVLSGGPGTDALNGGGGRDFAVGGPGRDRCLAEVLSACER